MKKLNNQREKEIYANAIKEIEKIILEDKKIKEFHNLLIKLEELKEKRE